MERWNVGHLLTQLLYKVVLLSNWKTEYLQRRKYLDKLDAEGLVTAQSFLT